MNSLLNRRAFLESTALGGTGLLILQSSGSAGSYQANEKLDIALIGVGGRGRWFVDTMPNLNTNVVAMCDVNERKASLSFHEIPQAKKYFDYRKMLDEMDKHSLPKWEIIRYDFPARGDMPPEMLVQFKDIRLRRF